MLPAKSSESCYTVQLTSQKNSKKNLELLNAKSYASNCKLMQIGSSLTVRCGCYERYADAKDELALHTPTNKRAAIATTYKYRFDDNVVEGKVATTVAVKKDYKNYKDEKASSSEEEELRLMLQVFLYKGDLESAFKIASLGYEKNKKSYYWNQKMAEISRWTNRSARSMKHLRVMYDLSKDPTMEKKLIDYGVSAYQYEDIEPLVVNRAKKDPSEKNVDLMILVFKKIGSPEKVVAVLDEEYQKDKSNTMLLTKALALSLEMGDLELAHKYVLLLEERKVYSKKDASLIAKYYYVNRDIESAYKALAHVSQEELASTDYEKVERDVYDEIIKNDDIIYYELKSDLGWYLQYNEAAAEASLVMMDMNASRLVDYERVAFVYQKSDPKLASSATRRAYSEYGLSYLFYSYANAAINTKHYAELRDLLETIDESSSPLAKESLYWLIKSKVYAHYKESELEEQALGRAYAVEPDNIQVKLELLWFYMDEKDMQSIEMLLTDMAEHPNLTTSTYFPMASAYFFINQVDRASYYMQLIKDTDTSLTNELEFRFLEAYIYQIQSNDEAFSSSMINIVNDLKTRAKENPALKKDNRFLSNYLRAAMYVLHPDKFEKKLKKAKKHLSKTNYNEISYSWALKNSADERSLKIYHKMHKKELWIEFSNAIVFNKHSEIENLLELYLHELSMGDAAQEAYKDGQVSLAQTITYEHLLYNEKNQNAYIAHLSLSQERSDLFDAKTSYYDRDPLLRKYIELNNKTYLQDGYFLLSGVKYSWDSSLDKSVLLKVADNTLNANLGLRRLYNRGSLELGIAYHDSMRSYFEYSILGKYRPSSDIYLGIELAKNQDALESTQLVVGGKKDKAALSVTWAFLSSTSLDFLYEKNSYSSQDDVNLGSGLYGRINLAQQIRNGYPDIRVGAFYDFGTYDETSGSRGVIDEIQKGLEPVLPNNFYNAGVNIAYGMVNSNLYTRVWRPYVEFFPYYNSDTDDFTYGFNAGYGGKVFHQDHLVIGASYTDSVNGIGGKVFELFLKYQFMYYHP